MLISKGNPMLMGCSRYKDGYNFTYEAECDNVALLIFDVHMKLKERIELDSSMKCGNIFSVYVCDRKLDKSFYCYEIDGLMYLDPYAKAITDCGRFGQTDEEDVYLAAIDVADYDWEDDRPLNYDYSDCIFYKMNVRGFTKSRTSKVKDKGTFSGIINKIPYLKELGITTIELQPAYEFDEIGRFPQLTDTIMSKYGAGTHYSVDKNTRKIGDMSEDFISHLRHHILQLLQSIRGCLGIIQLNLRIWLKNCTEMALKSLWKCLLLTKVQALSCSV